VNDYMSKIKLILLIALVMLLIAGCSADLQAPDGVPPAGTPPGEPGEPALPGSPPEPDFTDDPDAWRINVVSVSGDVLWSFTEGDLRRLPPEQACDFTHVYSTINNWPTALFYAADGYSIEGILRAAGVYDIAQTITFRAPDGYEASLTREQLLSPQFFYPNVSGNADGAVPVLPIIAYRWRERTDDLSEIYENKPTLIFGQRNPFEHTNPAFVVNVAEIIVDEAPCDIWQEASTFPLPGAIAAGETVKLQHPGFGMVKLFYTLDGSEPTVFSTMYNPSTYQPELNVPIPITERTVIRVLVTGYGKLDSEIAGFEFWPAD